jgi:hypothetical protein
MSCAADVASLDAGSRFTGLMRSLCAAPLLLLLAVTPAPAPAQGADEATQPSTAWMWNETLLKAICNDFARPAVHARNLVRLSVAMWDAWAAFDSRPPLNPGLHIYTLNRANASLLLWQRLCRSAGADYSSPKMAT